MEKRIYDPRISDLELAMSYGSLAIVERLVIRSNDPPHMKKNILLINGMTIIRNCYDKDKTDRDIIAQFIFDLEKINYYFDNYAQGESILLVYFQPGIYEYLNENIRRTVTKSREDYCRLCILLMSSNNLEFGKIKRMNSSGYSTAYATVFKNTFSYMYLPNIIRSIHQGNKKIWLVSHCPIDYFILNQLDTEIISSHTGNIVTRNDLGKRVFGEEDIPFNKTTYKLFGDKEFVKPLISNRPKALEKLKGIKLKLKTEAEIAKIAVNVLGVDKKLLSVPL